jgi:AraC-like DNA-binding protein
MVEAFQGDVIMANPGEIHDGLPMAGQTRIWQMIYLDPSFILGALSGEATSSFEIVHPVATDAKLARYIKRLFVNLLRPDADPQFRDESLLETLMQMRTRHTVAQCEPESRPCLAKALERLDSTPDTGVSLAELASVCGLSRFQFLRAFRAAFNITPDAEAHGTRESTPGSRSVTSGSRSHVRFCRSKSSYAQLPSPVWNHAGSLCRLDPVECPAAISFKTIRDSTCDQ